MMIYFLNIHLLLFLLLSFVLKVAQLVQVHLHGHGMEKKQKKQEMKQEKQEIKLTEQKEDSKEASNNPVNNNNVIVKLDNAMELDNPMELLLLNPKYPKLLALLTMTYKQTGHITLPLLKR